MTRWASTTNQTAAAAEHVSLRVLAKLDFVSGFVYVHDGAGTITYAGNDYVGVGSFGGVESVAEDLEQVARPVTLTLFVDTKEDVVDLSMLATATTEVYQNRTATLYMALLTPDLVLVDTPEVIWEGRMDQMKYTAAAGTAEIELRCEHRLAREPRIARYTNEDQQREYASDKFFEHLPSIPGYLNQWGAEKVAVGGGSLPGQADHYRPVRPF